MPQSDERQLPGTPLFLLNTGDATDPLSLHTGRKRLMEGQPPTGPHPLGQPEVRNQAAELLMPVPRQSILQNRVPKESEMRQRRERLPDPNIRLRSQCCQQGSRSCGVNLVRPYFRRHVALKSANRAGVSPGLASLNFLAQRRYKLGNLSVIALRRQPAVLVKLARAPATRTSCDKSRARNGVIANRKA